MLVSMHDVVVHGGGFVFTSGARVIYQDQESIGLAVGE